MLRRWSLSLGVSSGWRLGSSPCTPLDSPCQRAIFDAAFAGAAGETARRVAVTLRTAYSETPPGRGTKRTPHVNVTVFSLVRLVRLVRQVALALVVSHFRKLHRLPGTRSCI